MFGKSGKPGDKSALSDRVRQLGEKKAAPQPYEAPPPPKKLRPESKRHERHPQYKQAVLILDHERMGVVIKDINAQGARVDFFQRRELPEYVVLQETTLKLNHRARVMWQDGSSAGLMFVA
jgi:hypothetical protein